MLGRNIFLYLIFLVFLYFPYLWLGGVEFPTLILGFLIIAFGVTLNRRLIVDPSFLIFMMLSISLSFVSFLVTGLGERVFYLLVMSFALFYSAFWVVSFGLKFRTPDQLKLVLVNVISFNSLLIVLLNLRIINPDFFYSIVRTNPLVFDYPITRYPGLAYDAFSYVSTLSSFGLCLLFDLYSKKKVQIDSLLVLKAIILLASIVFSGRAGLLLLMLFVLFRLFPIIAVNVKFSVVSVCSLFIAFFVDWGQADWLKSWAFGFIFNAISGEVVLDSSVEGVKSMIFYPDNLIFGDNVSFVDVKSDLGFIKLLNSMGLFGGLLLVVYFLFILVKGISLRSIYLVFLALSIVVLNMKDVYFISPYGHTFFIFALIIIEGYNKKRSF